MKNDDLSDLILSIKLTAKDDYQASIKTTTYKLPKAALIDEVTAALYANFEHYESCSIDGGVLTLVHPEPED